MGVLAEKGEAVRIRLIRFFQRLGFREEMALILIAVLIGIFAGFGAVIFGWLIQFSERLFYSDLGSRLDLMGAGALFLPLVPAAGALFVGLLLTYLIPQAKGPGVPAVVYSLTQKGGIIPFRVAVGKTIGSALTIGSGGSAGTEAPIIHIGSTLGSTVGQWLKLPPQHMPVIVASGAAAGLGAIFNAPITGVLFALEIFLQDISYKTFTPVVIASVTAATLARSMTYQNLAMFAIPSSLTHYSYQWYELGNFALLGLVCGLVSVGFIRSFYLIETFFCRLRFPRVIKPVLGAFFMGLLGLAMLYTIQEPHHRPAIFGNGYNWIHFMLNPENYGRLIDGYSLTAKFLLLLMVLKLLATCLTLGSGGSGGEFGPALFVGAALGGSAGAIVNTLGVYGVSNPANYAIVGMAGLIAGTTHAPLTAILLLFEITGNYTIILPIMIASVLSTTCAQLINPNSIYTMHIKAMGIRMIGLANLAILRKVKISEIPICVCPVIHPDEPIESLVAKAKGYAGADFIVADRQGNLLGIVPGKDFRTALLYHEVLPLLIVDELVKPCPSLCTSDTLEAALNLFSKYDLESIPVVDCQEDKNKILGLITHSDLMIARDKALERS